MVKVLLISTNKRESEVLSLAFQQKAMKVIHSEPNYANYVRSLQYLPDILLMEMTQAYNEQVYFVRLLKKNKRTTKVPILTYGNHTNQEVIKQFYLNGVNKYYMRPIRFGDVLQDFNVYLKGKGVVVEDKSGADKQSKAEDIALILNKEKMASDKLEVMLKHIGKLMVFPFTVNRILKIADDDKSGAPELSKIIKTDQAMTTTILKVANSVIFASRDRKIADIREAVVRIGFRETKNIALSMMIMKLFSKNEKSAGYNRMDFWYHSLAVGVIAEKIAKTAGYKNTEEAFIAGLLHDFGVLMFDEFFSELLDRSMEIATKTGTSFIQAEKDLMGITHNDLAARLFEAWNIPRNIGESVKYQMEFSIFKSDADQELTRLVRIVGVANVLAKTMDIGKECDQWIQAVPNDIMEELRYPAGFRGAFFDEVYAGITMYSRFLGLDPRAFPEPKSLQDDKARYKIMIVNKAKRLFEPHMLYVNNLGCPTIKETPLSEITNAEELPVLIIMNADEKTVVNDLVPYLPNAKAGPVQHKPVQVLLFHDADGEVAGLPEHPSIKRLSKILDLRQIDFAVETLLPPVI